MTRLRLAQVSCPHLNKHALVDSTMSPTKEAEHVDRSTRPDSKGCSAQLCAETLCRGKRQDF